MRPHRLHVTAFGAFAETQRVCFDDLEGLFLLHGETGAGKTTLLDAIAFALYGRVPGERGKAKRLRSDHAKPGVVTEVELEATVGGRRLKITRKPEQERPKRSGAGLTREPAAVRLEEVTADGGWEVKSTRVGEADAEIADLIGMSAEQFFQVVLLPQGRFAQFLHADADAREELLRRLFGTDRFRAVENWLAERRRATADEVKDATTELDHLIARVSQVAGEPVPDQLPDPAAWLAGLAMAATAAQADAATVAAARKGDLDAALDAQTEAQQLAGRQRRRRDAVRKQQELEAAVPEIARLRVEADAASRAAEVAPVLDEADRAAAAAAAARAARQHALEAIPAELLARSRLSAALRGSVPPTAAAAALRAAAADQRAQFGRLDALRAVARQADDEDAAVVAGQTRAARLAADLADTRQEAARQRDTRPELVAARDAAREAAADLPGVQAEADSRLRVAADAAALVKDSAARERLHSEHLAAWEKANTLRAEALRVREARIDGMRAELAAALVDGAPCPVCGSLDHPELCELTGEPVSREQEDAANAVADKASAETDKAGQQVAAADAVIGQLGQRLTGAGFAVPADLAALTAAAAQAADEASRFDAAATALANAAAALGHLQTKLDALDAAIAAGAAKQAELAEQHTAALAEAEAAAQRAAARREELRAQLGDEPDLEAALTAAGRLAEALTVAAAATDETARTASEASAAAKRAANAARNAGFGGDDCAPADASAVDGDGAAANAIEAVRAAARDARWRGDAANRVSRHQTDSEAVATLLADPDLDVPLDPPAPVEATTQATAVAREKHDAAVDAHGRARHTAAQITQLQPTLVGALAALGPLRERASQARQLADLAGGLPPNQYRMTLSSFVLAARLEEVAAAASERLLTMTGGRYSLVHTDARRGGGKAGLGLLACDSWTGIDRDTSTLSGGETFLASLALALGLADVVTAEAAGTPMEALFVDEGFGTLDEDTLDEVMNVLDGLREGGRIVGIVSHVTELRQRIPAQVRVRKGQHGSHVEVTAG